jgi:hypothetical protein
MILLNVLGVNRILLIYPRANEKILESLVVRFSVSRIIEVDNIA